MASTVKIDILLIRRIPTKMQTLKRNLYEKALKLLDLFPVIAILGSRQCGKTTFSRQLASDWIYFD